MKVLGVLNNELVEVLWIDDNEISYIPIDEFIKENPEYKHIPISEWRKRWA